MGRFFGALILVGLLGGCETSGSTVGVNGSLTQMAGLASVEECPNGGVVLEHGIDVDESGELDAGEVTKTYVVCHGANGSDADAATEIAALRAELSALKAAVELNTAKEVITQAERDAIAVNSTKAGITQDQASSIAVSSYAVSNIPDFSGWDKNAADDFNGDYTTLINKPTTISQLQGEAIVVNSLKAGFPGFGVAAGKALEGTFTETDPVASAAGYLTSYTETDPVASAAGYLTSYIETDPVASAAGYHVGWGGDLPINTVLPFISIVQDNPSADQFVNHSARTNIRTNNTTSEISTYEWSVKDLNDTEILINSSAEHMEWIPTKTGRFIVSVIITYDNGTPNDPSDDKSITETRDIFVREGSEAFSATQRSEETILGWPLGSGTLSRTYQITSRCNESSVSEENISDWASGTITLNPSCDEDLFYTLTVVGVNNTIFYEKEIQAYPATASFEYWANDGGNSTQIEALSCDNYVGYFPFQSQDSTGGLTIRNISPWPLTYSFARGWSHATHLAGFARGLSRDYVTGILSPGHELDVHDFQAGKVGILGSAYPFVENGGLISDHMELPLAPSEQSALEDMGMRLNGAQIYQLELHNRSSCDEQ